MLSRFQRGKLAAITVLACIVWTGGIRAGSADSRSESAPLIAPNLGISYRVVGASFHQDAEKAEWPIFIAMGGAVTLEILAPGRNRIGLGTAYCRFLGDETEGTEQINVTSVRQQVDIFIDYRFHWTYLTLFAQAGGSAGIVSATTRMYELDGIALDENDAFVFTEKTLTAEEKSVGTVWGGVLTLGVGLDIGRLFTNRSVVKDNFLFWNLAAQYAVRNRRHEPGFWTSLSFYPMALRR